MHLFVNVEETIKIMLFIPLVWLGVFFYFNKKISGNPFAVFVNMERFVLIAIIVVTLASLKECQGIALVSSNLEDNQNLLCFFKVYDPEEKNFAIWQSWPADALQVVAQRFLAETEMSSTVRGGCVTMCQEFHTGTRDLSTRFLNELKRHNYVTPTSYLELISTFKVLLEKKQGIWKKSHSVFFFKTLVFFVIQLVMVLFDIF